MTSSPTPPLVAHIVYSFHIGGLENGVVNLINRMPESRFRHVVIALTDVDPVFAARVTRKDVTFISLHKPPGHGLRVYRQVYRLLRELRPSIVHTRNLAALEMTLPAWLARVPARIHGEHGWDSADPHGLSRKYQFLRRVHAPFVTHYIALSRDLAAYLTRRVGISFRRVARICNGVDVDNFCPRVSARSIPGAPDGFLDDGNFVVGTVGRLQEVKDQLTLVRAFGLWVNSGSASSRRARLMLVGDGPLRGAVEDEIGRLGIGALVWMAGARSDVNELMRSMNCFVLPSRAEGISNTLLEAMATGLPAIATDVGGNGELIDPDVTGLLVPPEDPQRMADALEAIGEDAGRCAAMAKAARERAVSAFSLDAMTSHYMALYDAVLDRP